MKWEMENWQVYELHFAINSVSQALDHQGSPNCFILKEKFCDPTDWSSQFSLSITNSWSLLKLMTIKSVIPSNHHILCHPLFLSPSIFPSIRVFSNESVLPIWWQKSWSFSFSISHSNEYSNEDSSWSPLGWTGWISLKPKGLSRVFSNTTAQKHQFFGTQISL